MGETILRTLRDTWTGYIEALGQILPRFLAMASVLLAGWLVSAVVHWLTVRVLRLLRFERMAERTGAAELLRKAELPSADRLVASLVFWLVFAGFLLAGVDALGFATIGILQDELAHLLPRLVTSGAILVVGLIVANLAWRVALIAAVNAGWPSARLAAGLVYSLIAALVVAMALHHVGVARSIVLTAFAIAFGTVLLAVAIAVGIGAAPVARQIIEERLRLRRRPSDDSAAHL